MSELLMSQLAATNMVYMRFSFDYFLDSMDRLGVHQLELYGQLRLAGPPLLSDPADVGADADAVLFDFLLPHTRRPHSEPILVLFALFYMGSVL